MSFFQFEGVQLQKTTTISQEKSTDNLLIAQKEENPETTTERTHMLTSDIAEGFLGEGASLLLMRVLAKYPERAKNLKLLGIDNLGQPCNVVWVSRILIFKTTAANIIVDRMTTACRRPMRGRLLSHFPWKPSVTES